MEIIKILCMQNQKIFRSLYLINMSVNNRDLKVSRIISEAINIEMELDEKILVFGEDVGKLGGVFASTIGLQKILNQLREEFSN